MVFAKKHVFAAGAIAIAGSIGGCVQNDSSAVKTDLGRAGNEAVLSSYGSYVAKGDAGCLAASDSPAKRVIVTGFGLFSGVAYNISGVAVQSMADSAFWSGTVVNGTTSSPGDADVAAASGLLAAEDFGGKAVNRVISVDGHSYQVCFLTLDVKWDLASSIIVYEMQRFKPDMVLMSGRGGLVDTVTLEAGALNVAMKLTGYSASGQELGAGNIPAVNGERILPDKVGPHGVADSIAMSWDNTALAAAATSPLRSIGLKIEAERAARPSNEYICNNVSYVALYAARGDKLKLAGEELEMEIPGGLPNAKIGFMHLPTGATNDAKTVRGIVTAYAAIIGAQLN